MPLLSMTIEDTSPVIKYSPGWTPGTSEDAQAFLYSQSTFQKTQTAGAIASIAFNGTGIQVFGAKRSNHGQYQIRIDNDIKDPVNVQGDPEQWQSVLFEAHGLPQTEHTVEIVNLQDQKFLDIDFINIESNVGGGGDRMFVNTFQDTDSSFTYGSKESDWSNTPKNVGSYMGSTGHVTSTSGTFVKFQFVGDGVSIYGPISTDGAPYSVELDGGIAQNFTSSSDRFIPQSLLYHATSLGDGQKHQLTIKYQPTASGQVFAVDFANVYTSISGNKSGFGLPSGAILGITVAVSASILIFVLLFWLVHRRRQVRNEEVEEEKFFPKPPLHPQGQVERRKPQRMTMSSFGPGPAPAPSIVPTPMPTRRRLPDPPPTGPGRLLVDTTVGSRGSTDFRWPRQPNSLGLSDSATRPDPDAYDGISSVPSDDQIIAPWSDIASLKIPLGTDGYPLEKIRQLEQEQANSSLVEGPTLRYPSIVKPAMNSSDMPTLSQDNASGSVSLGPPDYARAIGRVRVR